MSLVKTSLLNGIGLAIKLVMTLLTNKVIAFFFGPTGLAIYGQFQSLLTLVVGLAAAPGQNGIVRLTAANQDNPDVLHQYWSAALKAILLLSGTLAVLGVIISSFLAKYILNQPDLAGVLIVFFVTLPASPILILLLSCANGLADIRSYVFISILITLVTGIATMIGVLAYGMSGVIFAISVAQIVSLILSSIYLKSRKWFLFSYFFYGFSKKTLDDIFSLASMAFASVFCAPLVQIAIRYDMTSLLGLQAVGYWQAVSRLGDMYIVLITSLLAVYYLPRFSKTHDVKILRKDIKDFFLKVYPLFVLGYLGIIFFKEKIIVLIYSSEFLPAAYLMNWQMYSDLTKMFAWLTGYLFIARGAPKFFVFTELFVSILLVFLAGLFVRSYGTVGVLYASTLVNLIYCTTLIFNLVRSGKI